MQSNNVDTTVPAMIDEVKEEHTTLSPQDSGLGPRDQNTSLNSSEMMMLEKFKQMLDEERVQRQAERNESSSGTHLASSS